MAFEVMVDPETLREQVKEKYREVAMNPRGSFHFHTGRPLAARLGYDESVIASFPESAVESFSRHTNLPKRDSGVGTCDPAADRGTRATLSERSSRG